MCSIKLKLDIYKAYNNTYQSTVFYYDPKKSREVNAKIKRFERLADSTLHSAHMP